MPMTPRMFEVTTDDAPGIMAVVAWQESPVMKSPYWSVDIKPTNGVSLPVEPSRYLQIPPGDMPTDLVLKVEHLLREYHQVVRMVREANARWAKAKVTIRNKMTHD